MTAGLLALLAAALLLLGAAVVFGRRAVARERSRVEALERLAERLELSLDEVRLPTFPPFEHAPPLPEGAATLVADSLPGRAAFLEAVAAEVDRARAGATRLTLVLVRVADGTSPESLVEAVGEVTGRRAYAVGPSAVAFTLPGLGRADGLGVVARIESRSRSVGHAVEWEREQGETPAELVARLLGTPPSAEP